MDQKRVRDVVARRATAQGDAFRRFVAGIALLLAGALSTTSGCAEPVVRVLVQASPLAGSQFYALDALLPQIRPGDVLELQRDPDNAYDRKAIRVLWRGHMLGHLPRRENKAVAAAMDQGERLLGRVAEIRPDPDPWRRLRIEILVEL